MGKKKLSQLFQKFKKSKGSSFFDLKVIKESFPTPDSKQIDFEISSDLLSTFNWKSGQYITLNIMNGGKEYLRDYSICNLEGSEILSICVKKTKNGFISKYLVEETLLGKKIKASAPKGNFTLSIKPNEKRTLVAFAAGSGITPIYSIFQDILKNEPAAQFYLFYGNKSPETTIFFDEINAFKDQYSERFFPYYFYTEYKAENPIFEGRMDARKVDLLINQVLEWDEVDEILICGPNELSAHIREACIERGIHASQIHMELFTPIKTQPKKGKEILAPVPIKVVYQGKQSEMVWEDFSRSMLDALLDHNIEVPYSCKGGVCGTCVCMLKGDAQMGEQLALLDSEIAEGQFLPCVSYTAKGSLNLNFDDV